MSHRPNNDSRRPTSADFVRSEQATGSIRLATGQRAAVLPGNLLSELSAGLEPPTGDQTRHAVYKFGFEWALQDMVRLSRQLVTEFGGGSNLDLWQMDAKFVLDRWWGPLQSAGWGTCVLDLSSRSRGLAFVGLQHSLVANALAGATRPTCQLYAGLFAGAFSFFDRSESHAVEFQCASLGAPACRFVIGPTPQVDEVESWRHQQVAPEEIRRRLS
jgi:hypothetical protein